MKTENAIRERLVNHTVGVLKLANKHSSDKALAPVFNQVIRSAGSIGANVAEAHGSVTKEGFARYFHIALQSAHETNYWIDVLRAYGLQNEAAALESLSRENQEFARIIRASLTTMRSRKS